MLLVVCSASVRHFHIITNTHIIDIECALSSRHQKIQLLCCVVSKRFEKIFIPRKEKNKTQFQNYLNKLNRPSLYGVIISHKMLIHVHVFIITCFILFQWKQHTNNCGIVALNPVIMSINHKICAESDYEKPNKVQL